MAEHHDALLLRVLDLYEAHRRSGDRFADRFGIGSTILLAPHIRPDVARRDQAGIIAELPEFSAPMARRSTGFQSDEARPNLRRAAARPATARSQSRPLIARRAMLLIEDGPDLDAAHPGHRTEPRQLYCFVEVARLYEEKAAKEFLGLDERPVCARHLSIANADGHCRLGWLQRLRQDQVSAPPDLPVEVDRFVGQSYPLFLRQRRHGAAVDVDEANVLHRKISIAYMQG